MNTTFPSDHPIMDVAGRLPRLRERMAEADCEALLVTTLANVRYLTGFSGSAGLLLVLPDDLVLSTDGRYQYQSAEQLAGAGVEARIAVGNVAAQKEALAGAAGAIARLGLEAANVTWARQRTFSSDWFPSTELVPTEGLVEGLRRVKDAGEVARMAAAAAIADAALAAVKPMLIAGTTEADLAWPSTPRCGGWAPAAAPSTPSWPRAPMRPSLMPARQVAGLKTASSWCSTSAPWSTATAPT